MILVERQVAFILAAAVAGVAMLGQEGHDVLLEAGGRGFCGRGQRSLGLVRGNCPQGSEYDRQKPALELQAA